MHSRLLALLIALFVGCLFAGCGGDVAVTSAVEGMGVIRNLEASSIADSEVALRWEASDTTVTGFLVEWKGNALRDTGTLQLDADQRSARVTDLAIGEYLFTVIPMRGSEQLVGRSIRWAGARRFDRDPSTGEPLRLYERFSSRSTGLSFDFITGVPGLVNLTLPMTFPPTPVALRIETTALTSVEFSIGPPAAYIRNGSAFDSIAAISDRAYGVESLDTWFLPGQLAGLFRSDGNLTAYNRIPAAPGNNSGVGFLLRVGFGTPAAPWHYARVLIKNNGGRLLRGNAPDRYVELEISYQVAEGLPYARRTVFPVLYRAERP